MSGKNKKKGQKALSLAEFHAQITESTGTSAATPQSRINWADEMERLDEPPPSDFIFDRSQLPSAPKAILAPDIDLEQVPRQPPFTAHLSNVSFEADEAKIRTFFRESAILNVRLPLDERGRFKGQGFVDFADRESLINALHKHETSFFNRPIRVTLESKYRQQQHQRHNDQQQGSLASDEADWRRPQPAADQGQGPLPPKSHSFHYQHGDQQQRRPYQNSGGGYQRRGGGQHQHGEHRQQWQQRGGQRDGGQQDGGEQRQQRRPYQPRPRPERNEEGAGGAESGEAALNKSSSGEMPTRERPKVQLAPRTLPVGQTAEEEQAAASAIFGSAKPVNTAAREREIEQRIKEREAAEKAERERLEKERLEREKEQPAAVASPEPEAAAAPQSESAAAGGGRRSHKTSVSSDHHSTGGEFQVAGAKSHGPRGGDHHGQHHQQQSRQYHHKNDNNNNPIRHQRLTPSGSFTSPPSSGRGEYQQRREHQQQQQHRDHPPREQHQGKPNHHHQQQPAAPAENPWKTKTAAVDLFKQQDDSSEAPATSNAPSQQRRPYNAQARTDRPDRTQQQQQFRPGSNRDRDNNKERRFQPGGGGGGSGGNNRPRNNQTRDGAPAATSQKPRGEYQPRAARAVEVREGGESTSSAAPSGGAGLGFVNKFSGLKVDVEDVDDDGEDFEGGDEEADENEE